MAGRWVFEGEEAGLSFVETVHDIALADYSSRGDAERIVVNVHALYREFSGDTAPVNLVELFGLMAKVARAWKSGT